MAKQPKSTIPSNPTVVKVEASKQGFVEQQVLLRNTRVMTGGGDFRVWDPISGLIRGNEIKKHWTDFPAGARFNVIYTSDKPDVTVCLCQIKDSTLAVQFRPESWNKILASCDRSKIQAELAEATRVLKEQQEAVSEPAKDNGGSSTENTEIAVADHH